MKKHTFLKSITFLWVIALFFSCDPGIDLSKVDGTVQFDQSLVFPLGEANVTVNKLLLQLDSVNSKYVTTGADLNDPITSAVFFSVELDKRYNIPDWDPLKNKNITPFYVGFTSLTSPVIIQKDSLLPISNNDFLIDLGFNRATDSIRVDKVDVEIATLSVKVTNTDFSIQPADLNIKIVFPEITKDGIKGYYLDVPLTVFGEVKELDISKFMINTSHKVGLPIYFRITALKDMTVKPTSKLKIELDVKSIIYNVAYGKFKLTSMSSRELTVPLDMLSTIPEGLRFADPRAIFDVESNVGSCMKFDINYVKAFSFNQPSNDIWALFNGNIYTHEYLKERAVTPGEIVHNQLIRLDKDYGNTNKLFDNSLQRDSLKYKFSVVNDSTLDKTGSPMFIIPNMYVKANVKIQVPLQIKDSFEYNGSIAIASNAFNGITKGSLVLDVMNGMPSKIDLVVRFLDAQGNRIIDALGNPINDTTFTINPPIFDGRGIGLVDHTKLYTSQPHEVALTPSRIASLKSARKMEYIIKLYSEDKDENNNRFMYFTTKDFFKVKLGVFVKTDTTLDLLNN